MLWQNLTQTMLLVCPPGVRLGSQSKFSVMLWIHLIQASGSILAQQAASHQKLCRLSSAKPSCRPVSPHPGLYGALLSLINILTTPLAKKCDQDFGKFHRGANYGWLVWVLLVGRGMLCWRVEKRLANNWSNRTILKSSHKVPTR